MGVKNFAITIGVFGLNEPGGALKAFQPEVFGCFLAAWRAARGVFARAPYRRATLPHLSGSLTLSYEGPRRFCWLQPLAALL
jgi:hypothetical protein